MVTRDKLLTNLKIVESKLRSNGQKPRVKLWSIAYCSRLSEPLSDAELAGLALHAQTRNETLGISGVLFLADDQVVQILEGRHGPVSWLYGQIKADPRHCNIVTLLDKSLAEPNFDGWRMRVMTADDLRAPERMIVLDALRSEGHADHGRNSAKPAASLLACPGAIVTGSHRKWLVASSFGSAVA